MRRINKMADTKEGHDEERGLVLLDVLGHHGGENVDILCRDMQTQSIRERERERGVEGGGKGERPTMTSEETPLMVWHGTKQL